MATFQLSTAASLNLGWSQNGVSGKGLKSLNNHIAVVVCSFFEFGMVSKWCIREWVKSTNAALNYGSIESQFVQQTTGLSGRPIL